MTDIGIDRERLTDALGEALDEVYTFLSFKPRQYLRESCCTIASIGLKEYFNTIGLQSSLKVSRPRLSFDPRMSHTFVEVIYQGEEVIVEPTYTQFLGYVGLANFVELDTYYPEHPIAIVPSSGRAQIADDLTAAAMLFGRERENINPAFWSRGPQPLAGVPAAQIHEAFSAIWAPQHVSAYRLSPSAASPGYQVGRLVARAMSGLENKA